MKILIIATLFPPRRSSQIVPISSSNLIKLTNWKYFYKYFSFLLRLWHTETPQLIFVSYNRFFGQINFSASIRFSTWYLYFLIYLNIKPEILCKISDLEDRGDWVEGEKFNQQSVQHLVGAKSSCYRWYLALMFWTESRYQQLLVVLSDWSSKALTNCPSLDTRIIDYSLQNTSSLASQYHLTRPAKREAVKIEKKCEIFPCISGQIRPF